MDRLSLTGSSGFVAGFLYGVILVAALACAPVSLFETLFLQLNPLPFHTYSLDIVEGLVVVTGCSSGIGRDAAFFLAEQGYHVFATVRKEEDKLQLQQDFSERLSTSSNSKIGDTKIADLLYPVICDVTDDSLVHALKDKVQAWLAELGPQPTTYEPDTSSKPRVLVGIVNNAGISSKLEPFEKTPMDAWDKVLDVNLKGPLRMAQAFIPLLRRSKGRLVNVGSLAGQTARPYKGPYTVSKFALEGLSDTLRQELHMDKVSVSMINPGFIRTRIFGKSKPAYDRDDITPKQQSMMKEYEENLATLLPNAGKEEDASLDIFHALSSPSPKTRYYPGALGLVAGWGAWVYPKLKMIMPDRAGDAMIIKKLFPEAAARRKTRTFPKSKHD
jgi:NAD(P)-dependent dehydrogenase (short-subunit alcohol dehydrogenase family)